MIYVCIQACLYEQAIKRNGSKSLIFIQEKYVVPASQNMNKESIVAKYLAASLLNFLNKLQYQAAKETKHCINTENYKVSCPKK